MERPRRRADRRFPEARRGEAVGGARNLPPARPRQARTEPRDRRRGRPCRGRGAPRPRRVAGSLYRLRGASGRFLGPCDSENETPLRSRRSEAPRLVCLRYALSPGGSSGRPHESHRPARPVDSRFASRSLRPRSNGRSLASRSSRFWRRRPNGFNRTSSRTSATTSTSSDPPKTARHGSRGIRARSC